MKFDIGFTVVTILGLVVGFFSGSLYTENRLLKEGISQTISIRCPCNCDCDSPKPKPNGNVDERGYPKPIPFPRPRGKSPTSGELKVEPTNIKVKVIGDSE